MKLDTKALRYLTPEDWRVLTAVSSIFSVPISTAVERHMVPFSLALLYLPAPLPRVPGIR